MVRVALLVVLSLVGVAGVDREATDSELPDGGWGRMTRAGEGTQPVAHTYVVVLHVHGLPDVLKRDSLMDHHFRTTHFKQRLETRIGADCVVEAELEEQKALEVCLERAPDGCDLVRLWQTRVSENLIDVGVEARAMTGEHDPMKRQINCEGSDEEDWKTCWSDFLQDFENAIAEHHTERHGAREPSNTEPR